MKEKEKAQNELLKLSLLSVTGQGENQLVELELFGLQYPILFCLHFY